MDHSTNVSNTAMYTLTVRIITGAPTAMRSYDGSLEIVNLNASNSGSDWTIADHRLCLRWFQSPVGVTDPFDHSITIEYDFAGRVQQITDVLSQTCHFSSWQECGLPDRVSDEATFTTAKLLLNPGRYLRDTNQRDFRHALVHVRPVRQLDRL